MPGWCPRFRCSEQVVITYKAHSSSPAVLFSNQPPRDLMPRVATLPLGSGALAGNPFLVDRQVRWDALVIISALWWIEGLSNRHFAQQSAPLA
jgi:argininosuccinate lyase